MTPKEAAVNNWSRGIDHILYADVSAVASLVTYLGSRPDTRLVRSVERRKRFLMTQCPAWEHMGVAQSHLHPIIWPESRKVTPTWAFEGD